jgi:hypothetical protein
MPLKVVEIERTCQAFPSQWEGKTDDGRFVYVRFRWGLLRIGVGATLDLAIIDEQTTIFERQLSDARDGELSFEQLRAATTGVVDWPVD